MSLKKGDAPQRKKVKIKLEDFDKDVQPIVQELVDRANETLFMWETFPIVLPDTISGSIKPEDLFIQPQFTEDVRRSGLTSANQRKYFAETQLKELRATGEFQVESVEFPGRYHRWILNQLLIKGYQKVENTFMEDISRALYLIVIVARRRIYSPCCSLAQGFNAVLRGLMVFLDMIIGLPAMENVNLEMQLQKERSRYLVAELNSPNPTALQQLYDWVKSYDSSWHAKSETFQPPVDIVYNFQTANGVKIDLSLCCREIIRDAKPYLFQILTSAMQGWIPERRKEMLSRLRNLNHSDEFIETSIKTEIESEYLERVCRDVLADVRLNRLGKDIPRLLVEQVQTFTVINSALERHEMNLRQHCNEIESTLKQNHPILSKISEWMQEKLRDATQLYFENHQWDAHQSAIHACEEKGLDQSAYFLKRDLSFRRDREPTLRDELKKVKQPILNFTFKTKIWFPKNWIIMEKVGQEGKFETIPTVISNDETTFRPGNTASTIEYKIIKHTEKTNTSRYIFWRWTNFILRTWSFFWNAVFFLGVVIPWCSPVSFRALFYLEPFFPDYEVNPANGNLRKSRNSQTLTMIYRIKAIWTYIRRDMEAFENAPDTGLLSKSISRYVKYVTNYLIKGFFGTILVAVGMTFACILLSTFSLILAVTSPIHIPILSLAFHLLAMLLWDFEGEGCTSAILWNVVFNIPVFGVCPIVIAIIVVIFCPVGSVILGTFAFVRKALRNAWDSIIFQIIQKRVRIPLRDDFLTHRIAGPGLASEHYYQIKSDQALFAVRLRMERDHINAFKEQIKQEILVPENECKSFIKEYFGPFGFWFCESNRGPMNDIRTNCEALVQKLEESVSRRLNMMSRASSISSETRSRIRMTEMDLRQVLQQGSHMAQEFYPENVFVGMSEWEKTKFWDQKELPRDDWLGLCANHLQEEFSADITIPLQPQDNSFLLKTQHWSLPRVINMAFDAKWRDDLDVTRIIQAPRAISSLGDISPSRSTFANQPTIPVEAFNPMDYQPAREKDRSRPFGVIGCLFDRRWFLFKFRDPNHLQAPKLGNPLPQTHPLEICILIHLRDSPSSSSSNPININNVSLTDLIHNLTEPGPYSFEEDDTNSDPEEGTSSSSANQDTDGGKSKHALNPLDLETLDKEIDDMNASDDEDDDKDGPPAAEPLLNPRKGSSQFYEKTSPRSPTKDSYSTLV